MPRSRAICACDLPLLCTKCTASSLNSFVKVRNSFGMMSSSERLSSKFILSEKVRQAQREKGVSLKSKKNKLLLNKEKPHEEVYRKVSGGRTSVSVQTDRPGSGVGAKTDARTYFTESRQ